MLLQLRDFIQRAGVVSTQQLTREFNVDEQALQPMLAFWERKNVIQQCQEKTACQSRCRGCKPNAPIFYQAILSS